MTEALMPPEPERSADCGEASCDYLAQFFRPQVVARFERAPGVTVVVMVEDMETDIEFLEVPPK